MDTDTKKTTKKRNDDSYQFVNWGGKANSFLDKILRGVYIFLLFAIDFVMFVYSVNGKLMESGSFNPAIFMILSGLLIFSIVLILLLAFSKDLQNLVCSICTMLVVVAFFYQFGQGDIDNFIEHWCDKHASFLSYFCIIPSPWMIGLFLGVVIFFLFRNSLTLLFVTMVLLFIGLVGVQRNEFIKQPQNEYQEIKTFSALSDQVEKENLIYLFIPKLPSYHLFNGVKDKNLRELRDIVIGFLADNGFEFYPNAFVQKNDTMSNIIDILNQVDYTSQRSRSRGFAEFVNNWIFVKGGLDILSLERNELNSRLQQEGYKISMYAMPGFNFCMLKDDFYTDRCVVKNDKSVSLYDKQASTEKNIYALLGEWIVSLKSRDFRSFAKTFVNMSSLKNYKVLSDNRRISAEGSVEIFDELLDDFKRDPNGHVYLTYIDLPSDMYIYDEYCNLKPRKDWIALKDNVLYPGGIDAKRAAYAEQTKCLMGKLQEFMESLYTTTKLQKTNIIVQGVSTIRELSEMAGDLYSNFVSEGMVTLGIRRAQSPQFLINANICLASDFTKAFINHEDYCFSLDNMPKYNADDKYNLKKNLINNSIIRSGLLRNSVGNFRDWYKKYKANSASYLKKMQMIEEENQRQKNAEIIADDTVHAVNPNGSQNNENIFFPTDEPVVNDAQEDLLLTVSGDENTEAKKNDDSADIPPAEKATEAVVEQPVQDEAKATEAVVEQPVQNEAKVADDKVESKTEANEKKTPDGSELELF